MSSPLLPTATPEKVVRVVQPEVARPLLEQTIERRRLLTAQSLKVERLKRRLDREAAILRVLLDLSHD